MIECKIYSLPELKSTLHISKRMWEERKEELLEYLKLFFDYELTLKGRGYSFNIKEQYAEYEPLPRKSKTKEIQEFYNHEVDNILVYKPRNTGANLAREIIDKNNKYKHAEGTAANYIRPYLKTNFLVEDKAWCKIDYLHYSYDKISNEELNYLKSLFTKYLSSNNVADIIAEQEAGYTSKEEAYDKLKGYYNNAINDFKEKYGFRPYKAGELRRKAEFNEPIEE